MTGWVDKVWFWFKNWNGQEQAKVKEAVSWTLDQFNRNLPPQNPQLCQLVLPQLFDPEKGAIGRMSRAVFDRTIIRTKSDLSRHVAPNGVIRIQIGEGHFFDIKDSNVQGIVYQDIDLGSEIANKNLWKLLNRGPKEGFRLQANGKLKKARLSHLSKQEKLEVRKAVSQVIAQLAQSMRGLQNDRIHKVVLEHLLTKTSLTQMSRKMYDRSVIAEGSIIEEILMPELAEKRMRLDAALQNYQQNVGNGEQVEEQALLDLEAALMEHTFFEFKFAQKLGFDLKPIGKEGSGGARYARDRLGHKILVIKPGDEGPHGVNNPTWFARFKRFFVSPRACLDGNSEELAEVDSYRLDRCLRLHLVPPTEMRHVFSTSFVGKKRKQCSIQLYVDGCTPLADHLGFAHHILPRFLLRWYYGSESVKQKYMPIDISEQKLITLLYASEADLTSEELEWKRQILENKGVPQHLMERLAIGKFATEDLDTHLKNVLLKTIDPQTLEQGVLGKIFKGKEVEPEEMRGFVGSLFAQEGHQRLLEFLTHSEDTLVHGQRKKMLFVNIDGGSSHPRTHPGILDYLALRFKHFFEVLAHYAEPFSSRASDLIHDRDEAFKTFQREKALRSLENIMTPTVFAAFWNEENKDLFDQWIDSLGTNEHITKELKKLLKQNAYQLNRWDAMAAKTTFLDVRHDQRVFSIVNPYEITISRGNQVFSLHAKAGQSFCGMTAEGDFLYIKCGDGKIIQWNYKKRTVLKTIQPWNKNDSKVHKKYFRYHLDRIRDNMHSRLECWMILKEYTQNGKPMRELLSIRTKSDFQRELTRLNTEQALS